MGIGWVVDEVAAATVECPLCLTEGLLNHVMLLLRMFFAFSLVFDCVSHFVVSNLCVFLF